MKNRVTRNRVTGIRVTGGLAVHTPKYITLTVVLSTLNSSIFRLEALKYLGNYHFFVHPLHRPLKFEAALQKKGDFNL